MVKGKIELKESWSNIYNIRKNNSICKILGAIMSQIRSKSNSITEKYEKSGRLMVGMQLSFKLFFMFFSTFKIFNSFNSKKHFIIKNKNIGDD